MHTSTTGPRGRNNDYKHSHYYARKMSGANEVTHPILTLYRMYVFGIKYQVNIMYCSE